MKKTLKNICVAFVVVALALGTLLFAISAIVFVADIKEADFKTTIITPFISFVMLSIGFCIMLIWLLSKKKKLLKIAIVSLCTGIILIPVAFLVNSKITSLWEKSVKLTYLDIENISYSENLNYDYLKYDIENITNKTLSNVVVVFECEGYDENGNDVKWRKRYETHVDIEPNNSKEIRIMIASLEPDDQHYSKSEIDYIVWD